MGHDARRYQLGQEIRRQRKARGLTLDDLGRMAGTTYGYVWELEKGRKSPTVDKLCAIADAMGIAVFELIPF